jgi:hypothetical protein
MEFKVAPVTVKVVEPLTEPNAALILVVPAPIADAKPCEPGALLMAAVVGTEETQVTLLLKF